MKKNQLKEEIRSLLKGGGNIDIVYYYDNSFHIIRDCKLTEINQDEAFQSLESGGEFWNLLQDKRKFDIELGQWIGEIPVHVLPSGIPKCKAVNITTAFPVIDFMNFHVSLIKNASENPKITGIQILEDK